MTSVSGFLEGRLKLKVNRDKSAVDEPINRVFLGDSFLKDPRVRIRVPEKTCMKMRGKLKELFRMGRGRNLESFIRKDLNPVLRGWMTCFRLSETKTCAEELDGWVRRRLRCVLWSQWKNYATRQRRLVEHGLDKANARRGAGNGRGRWYNSAMAFLQTALPSKTFANMGLVSLLDILKSAQVRPSV